MQEVEVVIMTTEEVVCLVILVDIIQVILIEE